eukprot:TRINITY_DN1078_c0_g6_i1.p1 TRINITY_DN1078_c0_g6~~TRINITY_DN1078_c0_g6_i1.p1  ORF type:complete len:397 (+),score=119.87 TRINITY_DN1078_c0_g6_i1:24-1193(+)
MIRRPPRSTPLYSSAASDVYKRQDVSLEPIVYLDIGTSAVKATHLSSKWKALVPGDKFASTKTYNFPRFALSRIDTAETESDITENVEVALGNLYNSKDIESYPEFENPKLRKRDRFHIMQLMYNLMNGIIYPKGDEMCPLLLTEKLNTTTKQRAKVFEHVFETMNVPAFYLTSTPVLTLFSEYRDTGMVVEASESTTHIIGIKDGYALRNFLGDYSRTGFDVTRELMARSGSDAWDNLNPRERVTVKLVRDCVIQPTSPLECVTNEQLDKAVTEVYFPTGGKSVVDEIQATMTRVMEKILSLTTMFDNLTIAGGMAPIAGLDNKIIVNLNSRNDKILANLIPRKATHKLAAPVIGARMLAAVPGFKDIMSTKTKYYERGAEHLASKIA